MSEWKLENDRMILKAVDKAGEMTSLFDKKTGHELLYQADQGWSGRNPSLFPMVGKTWNGGRYEWNGRTYEMKNHGLVRYSNLQVRQDGNSLIFTLDSDERTRSQYPFDFHFEMKQTLLEDGVQVDYSIVNTGKEDMPFSFGLHPAFKTVQNDGEAFEDFSIEFSPAAQAEQIVFFPDLRPVSREEVTLDTWNLSHEDIEKYATLVFDKISANEAVLKHKDQPRMKMSFPGYPSVALWNSDAGSDFICIEPWFGHSDLEKTDAAFDKREGTQILKPGEEFTASYTVQTLE